MNDLEPALNRAFDRYNRQEERIEQNESYGDTRAALQIADTYREPLSHRIKERLQAPERGRERAIALVLRGLSYEIIAQAILQSGIDVAANSFRFALLTRTVGKALYFEALKAELLRHNKDLADAVSHSVRKLGSLNRKQQQVQKNLKRIGIKHSEWSTDLLIIVGTWAVNLLVEALPDVFSWEEKGNERYLDLNPNVVSRAFELANVYWNRSPIFAPQFVPPTPWTDFQRGGPEDCEKLKPTLVRHCNHPESVAAIRGNIKTGKMQVSIDGLNALQSVGWKINQPVLKIMKACYEKKIRVDGVPLQEELPERPKRFDTESDFDEWRQKRKDVEDYNKAQRNDQIVFELGLVCADNIGDRTFWLPMNLDFRGRTYAMSGFNFQGSDRMRSLFVFAEGEPIGDRGLYWLQVHVANCGEFDGVHKRSFDERVQWTIKHTKRIQDMVSNPLEDLWWTKAPGSPFAFLAACMELVGALATPPGTFITHLPVSFDGSCSGLQHLCAMTRDPQGALVNLTPSDRPQDVYMEVANRVFAEIETSEDPIAKLWLDYVKMPNAKSKREIVKRNTMTYFYSSPQRGLENQQLEDLMGELKDDVARRKFDRHPFGDNQKQWEAAHFMSKIVYRVIGEVVPLPAKVMKFFQKIARAHAHERKPTRFMTPAGFELFNRYYEEEEEQLKLFLHIRGAKKRYRPIVYKDGPKINKSEAANGIAPNVVHSLDACHLFMVAKAAIDKGIQLLTIHDAYGCLPSRADELNRSIREEFVRMYTEHDLLAEILEQAKRDLTEHNWHRLPELPQYGTLNINEVLNATYAFA